MAAILRRHRFVIFFITCLLMLMLLMHFNWKEKSIVNIASISIVNKNLKDEIQMFHLYKKFPADITKISNKIAEEQLPFIVKRDLPEDKKNFPFIKNIVKEHTQYQLEEIRQFISKHVKAEFTTEFMWELDEKSLIGVEEIYIRPTIQDPEIKFSTPSEVGLVRDTKYLRFEQPLLANGDKEVSLSALQQNEAGFPASNGDSEWAKTDPLLRNIIDKTDLLRINKHITLNQQESSSMEFSTDKKTVLLIDTPGCKIPRLDPWDPTIKHLIELQKPYECPGPPVFLKSNPGGSITLNKNILETYYNITQEELTCFYQPIYRMYEEDKARERSIMFGTAKRLEFGIPIEEDHVATICKINGKKYEQYLPLVPLKKNIEEERNTKIPPNPKLNVILVGIDSVSKLNFLRHFPRTHAFLTDKLKPFEMNGYTKVGDNTFPNLVPMLTGQFVEYWWNETMKDTMFFDNINLIWKEYAKRGYRTFYAEDSPFTGTFNYLKRGFHDPPTDYYFRPLGLALERWKLMKGQKKEFCFKSQLDFDIVYDYLKEFTQTMETRPYFGFAMVSTITHDDLNYAGWADEPTVRLLEGLMTTGAFNNTVFVLFSDHGLRYGKICQTYIGKFEQKLPLMYVHVPKWFLDQYPDIDKNLQINQNRLMTLFDIHATMVHLLDLSKRQAERSVVTLGRSLFEEIPPGRSCSDAYIEHHFCPCNIFEEVSVSNLEVIYASQAIVNDINSKLEPYGGICEILEVDTIVDARVGKANKIYYTITVITKPGGAVFEGTVRHNPKDNNHNVVGLSRISMYKNTSWCIESQKMKIFCYCKIQQPN